ncbi:DnaT-like ssDNA-binding protein [Janthinobacterium sp. HLX7-2]|uniref:DnaT-like ssDNA-binding protein n=1 Tax=Janthinobacterium sp. HLX7-2 TaxID=1259331 RepID=UPI003F200B56
MIVVIIESGTGLPNADSYAGIAAADARCASLGLAALSALDQAAKEIALRKAMIFMPTYRTRWAGRRVYSHQALDWPHGRKYEGALEVIEQGGARRLQNLGETWAKTQTIPALSRQAIQVPLSICTMATVVCKGLRQGARISV